MPGATPTYARGFADSLGLFVPPPELEDESPAGEAARKLTGDHFNHHARFEFNIPGITFGGRYDGSPIVVPDGTAPPPDAAEQLPARPPARAAARRISGSATAARSTTRSASSSRCLRSGQSPPTRRRSARPPRRMNMPLPSCPSPGDEARDLYGADLALIRPDQIVAWRGNSAAGRDPRAAPRGRA